MNACVLKALNFLPLIVAVRKAEEFVSFSFVQPNKQTAKIKHERIYILVIMKFLCS
jgi:hypothetical protein